MAPRTAIQFERMREEKIVLIMDVALEHFARSGFHATTIHHIAKHAGISNGLIYNYFESKEALLKAIIHKYVNEVYRYLDMDRDGHLSVGELEFFLRKITLILRERRYFWRLIIQLLTQDDARRELLSTLPEPDSLMHPGHEPGDYLYPSLILNMLTGYFSERNLIRGIAREDRTDFEMFSYTFSGYALKIIFSETEDAEADDRTLNRILELYK